MCQFSAQCRGEDPFLYPNFGAHHQEPIDKVKMEVPYRKWIAYFDDQTGVNAPGTDLA